MELQPVDYLWEDEDLQAAQRVCHELGPDLLFKVIEADLINNFNYYDQYFFVDDINELIELVRNASNKWQTMVDSQ